MALRTAEIWYLIGRWWLDVTQYINNFERKASRCCDQSCAHWSLSFRSILDLLHLNSFFQLIPSRSKHVLKLWVAHRLWRLWQDAAAVTHLSTCHTSFCICEATAAHLEVWKMHSAAVVISHLHRTFIHMEISITQCFHKSICQSKDVTVPQLPAWYTSNRPIFPPEAFTNQGADPSLYRRRFSSFWFLLEKMNHSWSMIIYLVFVFSNNFFAFWQSLLSFLEIILCPSVSRFLSPERRRSPLHWQDGVLANTYNVPQCTSIYVVRHRHIVPKKIPLSSDLIPLYSTMNAASMCLRTIHTDIFRMSTILRKSTQQFIRKHFDDQHGKTSKVRRWLVCSTVLHHAACCIQASCSPQFRKLHSSSRVSFPKHFTCSNQGINEWRDKHQALTWPHPSK